MQFSSSQPALLILLLKELNPCLEHRNIQLTQSLVAARQLGLTLSARLILTKMPEWRHTQWVLKPFPRQKAMWKEGPQDSEALSIVHVGRCFSPSFQSAHFSCGSGPEITGGTRGEQGLQYFFFSCWVILELIPVKQTWKREKTENFV